MKATAVILQNSNSMLSFLLTRAMLTKQPSSDKHDDNVSKVPAWKEDNHSNKKTEQNNDSMLLKQKQQNVMFYRDFSGTWKVMRLILLCPYGNKFFRFQDLLLSYLWKKWFHQVLIWKTKLKFQKFQFAADNKSPMLKQRNTHMIKIIFMAPMMSQRLFPICISRFRSIPASSIILFLTTAAYKILLFFKLSDHIFYVHDWHWHLF